MVERIFGRAVRGSCEARVKWFPYPSLFLTVPFVLFILLFCQPIQVSAQAAPPSLLPVHLTQVTPNSAVPGTEGLDIMLFGAGFAPGMQLRTGSPSVVVEYVQALSATLARARLRILPGAAPGPVRLDVISRDFTTFQQYTPPLFIQSPGGLAAPLSVRDAAVVFPQPGTLLAPDKPLFARGLLATTGSGVVIGVFTLDGVPFEQFSVIVSGGAPVSVQARIPVPFTYAGTHDLQIKILSPQQFTSGPVRLIGIPESRTLFQLVTPAAETVVAEKAPEFRWTVVPGAAAYQVLFQGSGDPVPRRVFKTAAAVWTPTATELKTLGRGTLYWTVRPLFPGDVPGSSAPWRKISLGAQTASGSYPPGPEAGSPGGVMSARAFMQQQPAQGGEPAQEPGGWTAQVGGEFNVISGSRPDQADTFRATLSSQADTGRDGWFLRETADGAFRHDFQDPNLTVNESRNWLFTGGRRKGKWGVEGQLGYGAVDILGDSQLVSGGLTRGGVEVKTETPFGGFGGYASYDDTIPALGSGSGAANLKVRAAAYSLPLPGDRFKLRLMGLWTSQDSSAYVPGGKGRVLGVLGRFDIVPAFGVQLEAARSRVEPDGLPSYEGNGYRLGFGGLVRQTSYMLNFRRVQADFGNPANPGYTQGGVPDRTGADLTLSRTFGSLSTSVFYQFAEDGVGTSLTAEKTKQQLGTLSFTYMMGTAGTATLQLNGEWRKGGADPGTGFAGVKSKVYGATLGFTEQLGKLTFGQTYTGQRVRDDLNPTTKLDMDSLVLNLGGNIGASFGLAATGSYTKTKGPSGTGTTDLGVLSLAPFWTIQKAHITVMPRLSYTRTYNDAGTADNRIEQYQLTLQWNPAWLNSLMAFQGTAEWNRGKDTLALAPIPHETRYFFNIALRWGGGRGGLNQAYAGPGPGVGSMSSPPMPGSPSNGGIGL